MSNLWYRVQYFFGVKLCPNCGSRDITTHGFHGANLRWKCKACGNIEYQPGSNG